jgi:hypothetical protein
MKQAIEEIKYLADNKLAGTAGKKYGRFYKIKRGQWFFNSFEKNSDCFSGTLNQVALAVSK